MKKCKQDVEIEAKWHQSTCATLMNCIWRSGQENKCRKSDVTEISKSRRHKKLLADRAKRADTSDDTTYDRSHIPRGCSAFSPHAGPHARWAGVMNCGVVDDDLLCRVRSRRVSRRHESPSPVFIPAASRTVISFFRQIAEKWPVHAFKRKHAFNGLPLVATLFVGLNARETRR